MDEANDTSYDLLKRVVNNHYNDADGENDTVVRIDCDTFDDDDFIYIQQLSEIIKDSGIPGNFELGHLSIAINSLNEYQNDLINV